TAGAGGRYRKVLELRRKIAQASPSVLENQTALALTRNAFGSLLFETGSRVEGNDLMKQALALRERLAHETPTFVRLQIDWAESLYNEANNLSTVGRRDEAVVSYNKALAVLKK